MPLLLLLHLATVLIKITRQSYYFKHRVKVNLVSLDSVTHFVTHCLFVYWSPLFISNIVRVIFMTRKEVRISSIINIVAPNLLLLFCFVIAFTVTTVAVFAIVAIIITSLKAASMGSLRELDHDGTNCFPVNTQNHAWGGGGGWGGAGGEGI